MAIVTYFSQFLNKGAFRALSDLKKYSKPSKSSSYLGMVKAGKVIGHLVASKNVDGKIWINTSYGGWFLHDPNGYETAELKEVELTEQQKLDAIKNAVTLATPMGDLVVKSGAVVQGAAETAEAAFDVVAFIGENMKYIAIGLAVVFAIIFLRK